ncbi:MAG: PaaI family thioesterase [Pseudomonadota bacterium]
MALTRDLLNKFTEYSPLCKAMDMRTEEVGAGFARLILPYETKLIGDPVTGVLHGGAISTLLDSTCGVAVMSHPEGEVNTATIDLRIDYMRPARAGFDVTAEAEVYHATRTVAFVRGKAWADDPDKPSAIATGAFVFAWKAP